MIVQLAGLVIFFLRVISQAHLGSTIVGYLMFGKENSSLLNKHFYDSTGKERSLLLVYPTGDNKDDTDIGV
jgi:hypothetical protein